MPSYNWFPIAVDINRKEFDSKDEDRLEKSFNEFKNMNHTPTIAELSQKAKNNWNQRGYLLTNAIKDIIDRERKELNG